MINFISSAKIQSPNVGLPSLIWKNHQRTNLQAVKIIKQKDESENITWRTVFFRRGNLLQCRIPIKNILKKI